MQSFPTARTVIVSDQNEGPVVNIVAWLGMTIMILCVGTRLASKFSVVRRTAIDDAAILLTMALAIAHTIALSMMVSKGLGQPQTHLNAGEFEDFQKYAYASQMLYIPVLYLAKLTTLIYLRSLNPDTPYEFLNNFIITAVTLWGVGTEFAIAFQCSMPHPWSGGLSQCFNRIAFWNASGVIDVLTDLAIIYVPIYLVWGVQMPRSKKVLVISIFAFRILSTPLTILRMYYLNTLSSPDLADQTLLSYLAYLATTLQVNTAVIVACIPFLKPFMEAMSTGGFSSTLVPMNSAFEFGSKQGSNQNIKLSINSWRAPQPKTSYKMESIIDVGPPGARGHSTRHEIDTDIEHRRENSQYDFNFAVSDSHAELGILSSDKVVLLNRTRPALESRKSSVGSEKMMITRTTEWNIEKTYCKSDGERTMKSDGSASQSIDK